MSSCWTKKRKCRTEAGIILKELEEADTLEGTAHRRHCLQQPNEELTFIQSELRASANEEIPAICDLEGDCDDDQNTELKFGNQFGLDNYDTDFEIQSDTEGSSDCDSTEEDHIERMTEGLVKWVGDYRITHAALGGLLQILRDFHPALPKDPRTLLRTKTTVPCVQLAGGSYCHFGITDSIEKTIAKDDLPEGDTISIKVNIDGLPLTKSSNMQLWPILAQVDNTQLNHEPMIIGAFSGSSKPSPVNDYLAQFVTEANNLYQRGIVVHGKQFKFKISCFICDTPARSLIKATKGHAGYNSCDKCVQKGEYRRKMTFPETNAQLRTDESVKNMTDKKHHTGSSILSSLPVGMVSGYPIDYMHLVCLGNARKLISLWLKGPLATRLGPALVKEISSKLLDLKSCVGCEFARKPRSLGDFERWKATEFRQMLLYTGMVVTRDILPRAMYDNFMLLSVAMTILLSRRLVNDLRDYAHVLLLRFVEHFGQLYGEEMITYNVHGLVHLCEESRRYGNLDNISAFPFENFLGQMKRLVRKPSFPLQQIDRRMSEKRPREQISKTFPLLKGDHYVGAAVKYKSVAVKAFEIKISTGDNCVSLKCGQIAVVEEITKKNDGIWLTCRSFESAEDFFTYPCNSSTVGIHKVSQLSNTLHSCLLSNVDSKCILLPSVPYHVAIPLLHC